MKRHLFIATSVYVLMMVLVYILISMPVKQSSHIVEINDIIHTIQDYWPDIDGAMSHLRQYDIPYFVMDEKGNIISYSEKYDKFEELPEGKNAEIRVNNEIKGSVFVVDESKKDLLKITKQLQAFIVIIFTVFFLLFCIVIYYVNKDVIKPAQELKKLCEQLADGNYDIAIRKYESGLLGVLSKSFEMMREELLFQRKKEQEADKNRREVIATISHDIKNPIASIQSIAEFQLFITADENLRKEFQGILDKTNHINYLIQNLHTSMLNELERLSVETKEVRSYLFTEILIKADYKNKLTSINVLDCLVLLDTIRLTQILDNIISNSYKYADTPIDVNSQYIESYLCVSINDYGPGVIKEEEIFLMQKYYRGKNAGNKEGSGIGLYVSKYLIERMGGKLECRTREPEGFEVKIYLKLV